MERCHSEVPVSGNGEENEEAENETAAKFNMNPAFEYIRYKANHDQFVKLVYYLIFLDAYNEYSDKFEMGYFMTFLNLLNI